MLAIRPRRSIYLAVLRLVNRDPFPLNFYLILASVKMALYVFVADPLTMIKSSNLSLVVTKKILQTLPLHCLKNNLQVHAVFHHLSSCKMMSTDR